MNENLRELYLQANDEVAYYNARFLKCKTKTCRVANHERALRAETLRRVLDEQIEADKRRALQR